MLELFGTVILGCIAVCAVGLAAIFTIGCIAGVKAATKKDK